MNTSISVVLKESSFELITSINEKVTNVLTSDENLTREENYVILNETLIKSNLMIAERSLFPNEMRPNRIKKQTHKNKNTYVVKRWLDDKLCFLECTDNKKDLRKINLRASVNVEKLIEEIKHV